MNEALTHISEALKNLKKSLQEAIIGQDNLLENLIITVFAGGHALIEGAPGLGKTRAIRALASSFSGDNKRISFTSDLLPSDLIGSEIFRPNTGKFDVRKWPIFTNILLADEINRTPPKVQSALLEAMEERQVTIGETTFVLPSPFFVFATQNPIENEGTYPLPEAQLDRFFMKIILDYPTIENEKNIFTSNLDETKITPIFSGDEIIEISNFLQKTIKIDEKIIDYIARLLDEYRKNTRTDTLFGTSHSLLEYWPSTRAGLALIRSAKVRALMNSRDFVLPEDIKALVPNIINHRIGLSYHSISEGISREQISEKILDTVILIA